MDLLELPKPWATAEQVDTESFRGEWVRPWIGTVVIPVHGPYGIRNTFQECDHWHHKEATAMKCAKKMLKARG